MREEEAAVQLQLCVFFIVAEVRDKLCSFFTSVRKRVIFCSEYQTILFFRGRLATLIINRMNKIKFNISNIAPTQLYRNSVMLASTQYENVSIPKINST